MNIVAIEDNVQFGKILIDALRQHSHKVTILRSADEALAALPTIAEYDLVILDLMMQRGDRQGHLDVAIETGVGIYQELRRIQPQKPLLVLTALPKSVVWSYFEEDKFARYCTKPLRPDLSEFYKLVEVW